MNYYQEISRSIGLNKKTAIALAIVGIVALVFSFINYSVFLVFAFFFIALFIYYLFESNNAAKLYQQIFDDNELAINKFFNAFGIKDMNYKRLFLKSNSQIKTKYEAFFNNDVPLSNGEVIKLFLIKEKNGLENLNKSDLESKDFDYHEYVDSTFKMICKDL